MKNLIILTFLLLTISAMSRAELNPKKVSRGPAIEKTLITFLN